MDAAKQTGGSPAEILRRYGALALTAAVRQDLIGGKVVASQLPMQVWPKQRVLITAVNAETGRGAPSTAIVASIWLMPSCHDRFFWLTSDAL